MLTVPTDRLPDAIGDLDPGNRALLDLSLRRGVSDAEIGELLRKEPTDVARGRDAVLELLADALDVGGHDRTERIKAAIAGLPDDAWQSRGAAAAPPAPPRERAQPVEPAEPVDGAEPIDGAEPAESADDRELDEDRVRAAWKLEEDAYFQAEPERSRRKGLFAMLGLLAVIAALIAAVLLAGGDDDDEPSGSGDNGSEPAQNGAPAPSGGGSSEQLSPLGGGKGSGEVTVTDEGATITLSGLPNPEPGTYQVWLYDSIVNSQSLGTVSGGSGRLEVKLPPDSGEYRYLDVSLEPSDANPNHSGDSVMRAPLNQLLSE
jgi:hypothetical protein